MAIQAVREDPYSAKTAMVVEGLSSAIQVINDSNVLSTVTNKSSRAMQMLSTWTVFDWLTRVVKEGLSEMNGTSTSWVATLARDIRIAMQQQHRRKILPGKATLKVRKYLPNYPEDSEWYFSVPRLVINEEQRNEKIGQVVRDAIRNWMKLSPHDTVVIQSSLIASLMECNSIAILFLDPVWKMFNRPHLHVINARKSNQRRSNPHTRFVLEQFYKLFQEHDLMNPNSHLGKRLSDLEEAINKWVPDINTRGGRRRKKKGGVVI
jgi:hypothetical protein